MERFETKWEEIEDCFRRYKVPGGWIINIYTLDEDGNSESACFVPDPKHEWEIK